MTLASRIVLSRLGLAVVLASVGLAAACGSEPETEPGATNACGAVGALAGAECTGLATCGAGAQNFKKVTPCDHCLASADSHVCEAGVCRAIDVTAYGTIKASFSLIQVGSTAQGLAQAAIYPVMADGTRLTCAALLSTCGFRENPAINANSSAQNVTQSGDILLSLTAMEAATDVLYFAQFTTETRGRGTVLAQGCVEEIVVVGGQTTEINVDLSAP